MYRPAANVVDDETGWQILAGARAAHLVTSEAVPTWSYTVVHVHGVLHLHHDDGWLRDLLSRLTDLHERGREEPWDGHRARRCRRDATVGEWI